MHWLSFPVFFFPQESLVLLIRKKRIVTSQFQPTSLSHEFLKIIIIMSHTVTTNVHCVVVSPKVVFMNSCPELTEVSLNDSYGDL